MKKTALSLGENHSRHHLEKVLIFFTYNSSIILDFYMGLC